MAFPDLDYNQIDIAYTENLVKTNTEGGTEKTRRKYTKTRQAISASLPLTSEADLLLLIAFYESVEMYDSFTWTHPLTGTIYTVRFTSPLKYKKTANHVNYYDVEPLQMKEI